MTLSGRTDKMLIMKPKIAPFLLTLSLLINACLGLLLFQNYRTQKQKGAQGRKKTLVARVVDGDTFATGKKETVRLAGVDTPEYPEQCLSQEAKERLSELINGQEINIEPVKKGKFGRTIAFVFKDGLLVDRILVQEGLGQAIKIDSLYQEEILAAEEEAKKLARGIWGPACQPPENCRIKGNYRRDRRTKIYHLPKCYNYEKIVINEREGDRWFCSEEEATKAGFAKSKDCPEEK